MPSKRKREAREDKLYRDGRFRISEDMWKNPHETLPKAKLLADANFPADLTKELKKEKIDIRTAQQLKLERLADDDLLAQAANQRRMLITMDEDFWSERKFPLHRSEAIIFVASGGAFNGSDGFYTLVAFLKAVGGGWNILKIKASADRVFLKMKELSGKVRQYEMKIFRGAGAFVRETGNDS